MKRLGLLVLLLALLLGPGASAVAAQNGPKPEPGPSEASPTPETSSSRPATVPILERGYLGMMVGPHGAESGSAFSRVEVLHLHEQGAARDAGIAVGDVISRFNGAGFEFPSIDAFHQSLDWIRPGDRIVLTLHRGGKTLEIPLEVGEQPEDVRARNLERVITREAERALLEIGPEERLRLTRTKDRDIAISTEADLSAEELEAIEKYLARLVESPAYGLMGEGDWVEFQVTPQRRRNRIYPRLEVAETSGIWAEVLMKLAPKPGE